MRRLALLDAVLLAFVLPLWLAALGLHLRQVAAGRLAFVGIYAAAADDPGGYPTVSGFWPGVEPPSPGPAIGDRLLRVGDADLKGVGALGFFTRAQA